MRRQLKHYLMSDLASFSPYSPRDIKQYFLDQKARIRKRWGQNFLIDPNISRQIAKHISKALLSSSQQERGKGTALLEVGPGFGALSIALLNQEYDVYAVEIDPALVRFLSQRNWGAHKTFYLLRADILAFFKGLGEAESFYFEKEYGGLRRSSVVRLEAEKKEIYADDDGESRRLEFVCGNLPYGISTDFFIHLMALPGLRGGVFLVQKEYAQRILSTEQRHSHSHSHSIGVFLHNYGHWSKCMDIKAQAFYPSPKIDSSLIAYHAHSDGLRCSPPVLEKLLRLSFGSRRKKLRNNWKKRLTDYFPQITLGELVRWAEEGGIKPNSRAEELRQDDFYFLSQRIEQRIDHL